MVTNPPRNIEALRAITDPAEQARAAKLYVEQRAEAITAANAIRDKAIRDLLKTRTTAVVAEMTGMSPSHVKAVRRWKP